MQMIRNKPCIGGFGVFFVVGVFFLEGGGGCGLFWFFFIFFWGGGGCGWGGGGDSCSCFWLRFFQII